ncbi:MAG: hypothetical protein A4E53_04010 [Pelotomaculum sp. PtaB.Bin104]|nr:MAG: hypothetical protein A4E53_04010 [Pelotomaculum sp. PtaB.Bin104]
MPDSNISFVKVKGYVYHIDANPIAEITVAVYEKGFRNRQLICKTKTVDTGYYEMQFNVRNPKLNQKNPVFQVELQEGNEKTILASDLREVKNAENELNFIIDTPKYKGNPRFNITGEAIKAIVGDLPYAELKEDSGQRDISFLSLQSGKPPQELALYVQARQYAEKTGIAPDVFYALMKMGFPRDLENILQNDREAVKRTLEEAAAKNIIDSRLLQNQNVIIKQLDNALAELVLDKKLRKSETAFGEILGLAIPDRNTPSRAIISCP